MPLQQWYLHVVHWIWIFNYMLEKK